MCKVTKAALLVVGITTLWCQSAIADGFKVGEHAYLIKNAAICPHYRNEVNLVGNVAVASQEMKSDPVNGNRLLQLTEERADSHNCLPNAHRQLITIIGKRKSMVLSLLQLKHTIYHIRINNGGVYWIDSGLLRHVHNIGPLGTFTPQVGQNAILVKNELVCPSLIALNREANGVYKAIKNGSHMQEKQAILNAIDSGCTMFRSDKIVNVVRESKRLPDVYLLRIPNGKTYWGPEAYLNQN